MAAKLTDRAVKTATPGRHMDGTIRGLSLLVQQSGARSWVLRYQLYGKRRDMGLGSYPEVTLAMARQLALDARRLVKIDRRDPVAERKQAKLAQALTFATAAEQLLESKRPGWRNANTSGNGSTRSGRSSIRSWAQWT